MSDILLTHSYFLKFDPKQWKAQKPYPPLGTLYAASVLKKNNFDVAFHDVMFDESTNDIKDFFQKHQPKLFVIYDDGFNYLTKMCLTNMREAAFEMAKIAKQNKCMVIISSSDSTDHTEEYFQNGFDFIIVGEAEQTLAELTRNLLNKNGELNSINGLRYVENNKIISTKKRENIRDLDSISFPAWDMVDMNNYKKRWLKSSGYFSLNMATTRGCPFKCNWCAKPIYGNQYHSRSPENVVEELKILKEKLQFDHIWFCDDIFGLKPGWINKFSELVSKNNLQLKFKVQCRADLLLDDENISALAFAGCDEVWIGAESGSQKTLDMMDKGINIKQIYEATKLLKKHKIKPCFFLQFGYTGETKSDIDSTLKMLFELMPHDIGISVSYPLPGTKFYDSVKENLKEKTNWTDSDDLAMMFESQYPQDFYKKLQKYVHKKFRQKQTEQVLKKVLLKKIFSFDYLKKLIRYPYYFFSFMPSTNETETI